jgi:hypothetical protein
LRYYAPRKTETNNLLIPVSGGEFTGDIYRNDIDENFVYNGAKNGKRYSIGNTGTHYLAASGYKVYAEKFGLNRTLAMDGFGRNVSMRVGNRIRTVFVPNTLIFTPIPGTENFEWETGDQGLYMRYKFVLEKSGSDYIWKTYIAQAPDFEWVDGDTTSYDDCRSVVMPNFDPFKHTPYLHSSGGVIENGIYDGRQIETTVPYYTTDGVVGVSAESPSITVSQTKYSIIVPSAITVEMNDEIAYLRNGVIEVQGGAKIERDKYLVNNGDGLYTASGDLKGIQYDYSLDTNANGASLAVTYASAGQIYPLATLTGVTEEREKPTYIPYATNGEFEYDTKTWEYTSDSGTITIYDNPLDNPDFIRAKVKLIVSGAEKYWEGRIPKQTAGIYRLGSFSYEGTTIYLIGVTITNYIIAYDGQPGGTEEAEWTLPAEFGFNRFIPTSGGTFTGAISASDGNPYTTSGQYEEMIQSRIDNPELAGDNYSTSYNMPITDDFLPFPGNPETIRGLYGPLNQSSLGTVATKELIIRSSYGNIDWHDGDWLNFNWFHKPVTVNDGAEHNYYITVRLNIVSTDPYELASDGSLWTLDCWKID